MFIGAGSFSRDKFCRSYRELGGHFCAIIKQKSFYLKAAFLPFIPFLFFFYTSESSGGFVFIIIIILQPPKRPLD